MIRKPYESKINFSRKEIDWSVEKDMNFGEKGISLIL